MQISVIKQPGGLLRPANQVDADLLSGLANGALLTGEFKQPRNPRFHRKFWAMVGFIYEYWEIPEGLEHNGIKPEKNLDRLRKDLLILAGFRQLVANVKGECRYEAESISFANMDETRFAEVYRAVFRVGWQMVLSKVSGMTEEAANQAIEELLRFD